MEFKRLAIDDMLKNLLRNLFGLTDESVPQR